MSPALAPLPPLETPPGFSVQQELRQATWNNGFRVDRGTEGPWIRYGSTTAPIEIRLAAGSPGGPWLVSFDHPGVATEMQGKALAVAGPGALTLSTATLGELHRLLSRVYALATSLPDAPLTTFVQQTATLPKSTEAERLVVQRVGQGIFRDALLAYWAGRCPMTGISDTALLRASHIVRWADCQTDEHRLDVHNGLLLSALWDAAFDAGRVSFANDGSVLLHPDFAPTDRKRLLAGAATSLGGLTHQHRANLAVHRARHGYDPDGTSNGSGALP